MKLDVNVLRYLSKDDWRVLTAVEMGQKNHEIVPVPLIDSIAGLRRGGTHVCLRTLLKHKLVHHEGKPYDGYRLTYMGYDFLAIKAMVNRGNIVAVGRQIGVGKESDVYEVVNGQDEILVLKLHRLGRTSFRAVKNTRDYVGRRTQYSWLYLSRLAALKEHAFMSALGAHGFPVPRAIDHNRHAVLMTMAQGRPLVQVRELRNPAKVYNQMVDIMERLAAVGLIHCDFNEFNVLVDERERVTMIDFPQMVSVSHPNAAALFERDAECIVRFFTRKLNHAVEKDPDIVRVRATFEQCAGTEASLDDELRASGFKQRYNQVIEGAIEADAVLEGVEDEDASDGDGDQGGSGAEWEAQHGEAGGDSCSDADRSPRRGDVEAEREGPRSADGHVAGEAPGSSDRDGAGRAEAGADGDSSSLGSGSWRSSESGSGSDSDSDSSGGLMFGTGADVEPVESQKHSRAWRRGQARGRGGGGGTQNVGAKVQAEARRRTAQSKARGAARAAGKKSRNKQ